MGQKVNPFIFRVILNRNWDCSWYSNKKLFSFYLEEDLKIRNFLNLYFKNIPLSKVIIRKNSVNVFVYIYIKNRSFIVSNKKFNLSFLEKNLSNIFKKTFYVNIKTISQPDLNPFLIFLKLKKKIENRKSYKSVLRNIINFAFYSHVKGVKIVFQGRIGGSVMTKKQVFNYGKMPLNRLVASIRYYSNYVVTKFGTVGIKIWLYLGDYVYY